MPVRAFKTIREMDSRYVNTDGDTVSGDLVVDGKLGVGITSPTEKLDVVGNVKTNGKFISSTTTDAPLQVSSTQLCTNLNADMTDGYHVGNAQNQIPLSNGTVCSGLNADMLDGYHVGNIQNRIPISNTIRCDGLNADMLDGRHAGNSTNEIPISNAIRCDGLNADMVDGVHTSNIPLQYVVSVSNVSEHYWTLSDDLAQRTYSVIYTANLVKHAGGGTLYLGFIFRNFSANTTRTIYYSYVTADIRLHGFYVVVVNDREWGKYHYIFITHRDTGGNSTISNYLAEATNYPALLSGVGFYVTTGYFNYHASITVIHA